MVEEGGGKGSIVVQSWESKEVSPQDAKRASIHESRNIDEAFLTGLSQI